MPWVFQCMEEGQAQYILPIHNFYGGSETHLVNCSEFTSTVDICLHYEAVGVGCPTDKLLILHQCGLYISAL